MRFLLDTYVVSEPLRPEPDARVLEMLERHSSDCAVSAPVWHELHFGCARLPEGDKRSTIERYLAEVVLPSFPVLPYDGRAAEWHGRERARLTAEGRTPSFVDGQIAAIAAVQGLALVTANRPHFEAFHDLVIEDWRSTMRP